MGKDALECKKIIELIDEVGLRKSVSGLRNCYEKLVKEFIVNIHRDCDNALSKEFRKVFARGCCVEFSPEVINRFLGRKEEVCTKLEAIDNQIFHEITSKQVKRWHVKGNLLASKLSVKYALLHRI